MDNKFRITEIDNIVAPDVIMQQIGQWLTLNRASIEMSKPQDTSLGDCITDIGNMNSEIERALSNLTTKVQHEPKHQSDSEVNSTPLTNVESSDSSAESIFNSEEILPNPIKARNKPVFGLSKKEDKQKEEPKQKPKREKKVKEETDKNDRGLFSFLKKKPNTDKPKKVREKKQHKSGSLGSIMDADVDEILLGEDALLFAMRESDDQSGIDGNEGDSVSSEEAVTSEEQEEEVDTILPSIEKDPLKSSATGDRYNYASPETGGVISTRGGQSR